MTVKAIKFLSGEEVLSSVKITDDSVILDKPLLMVNYVNSKTNNPEVSFSPWMISANFSETITVDKNKVLGIANPSEYAKSSYITAIGE